MARADWQGTVGGPRDAFGAPLGPTEPGPRLGYRGELEFAGQTWLRARAYDPATRSFLSPDPLPPVPGTAYAANPYHYAGNDPLGRVDPLGLRPVTEQELREIRDRMGQNFFARNADYIVAGALIVGGIAVMATGVGGPLGAAMIGGALLSAGASAGIQKVTTGSVNYTEVAIAGLVGGAAGGAGFGAGALVAGTSRAAAVGAARWPAASRASPAAPPTAASTAGIRSTRPGWRPICCSAAASAAWADGSGATSLSVVPRHERRRAGARDGQRGHHRAWRGELVAQDRRYIEALIGDSPAGRTTTSCASGPAPARTTRWSRSAGRAARITVENHPVYGELPRIESGEHAPGAHQGRA